MRRPTLTLSACLLLPALLTSATRAADPVDFNRDIRPILSGRCFKCHGPDAESREAGLRLDVRKGAVKELDSGMPAITPGKADESELIRRVASDDEFVRMPPPGHGEPLAESEVALLRRWIDAGANYEKHWSYKKPQRPALPAVSSRHWPRTAIDTFVLARLEQEGLNPSPEAPRTTLIRRASLHLTGLPPTPEAVDRFLSDKQPGAYERMIDRLLASPRFGERWARVWLDLARYADSQGYAQDSPRTIWRYRDWVIAAINENQPFDRFTIEQIAGDLLPEPTPRQLLATAFHRNTMTNSEGGTDNEEFRTAAVVDRVTTTMQVWMGSTFECAQCHSHKYDPFSQKEYYGLFAFFNNTADADRNDESPTMGFPTREQQRRKAALQTEINSLQSQLKKSAEQMAAERRRWEERLLAPIDWRTAKLLGTESTADAELTQQADGTIVAGKPSAAKKPTGEVTYEIKVTAPSGKVAAVRLDVPRQEARFVLSGVDISLPPDERTRHVGRYVRVEIPQQGSILSLAEVQVFAGGKNLAPLGEARQSSTAYDGPAGLAIDGNTDGHYSRAKSTTHTNGKDQPWWEVDLTQDRAIDRIVIWNRTDTPAISRRLRDFRVTVLDANRKVVWTRDVKQPPLPSRAFSLSGARQLSIAGVYGSSSSPGHPAANLLKAKSAGWSADVKRQPQHAVLLLATPVEADRLTIRLRHHEKDAAPLKRFRISVAGPSESLKRYHLPAEVLAALEVAAEKRTPQQSQVLTKYYTSVAPELKTARQRIARLQKELESIKPPTAPIMQELTDGRRRKTHIMIRGNFLMKGEEVSEHLPAALHPMPAGAPNSRLGLARWLVSPDNPLTPRVVMNRYWEQLFGRGLVETSEDFGLQGELPSHPRLLDWLAVEFVESGWDVKQMLRLIVTSSVYRQSSRVEPQLLERDPHNRLLARGPRFRLSAEMIRDHALFVGGILSTKMNGPSVRPPRPNLGLRAAFGGSTDWKASPGEDSYRRGLYTSWRRTTPYPSMTAFDAPSREVCTLRRVRTNTPLQAFVTLNDPVYVGAAQALARRIVREGGKTAEDRAEYGMKLCLARRPSEKELRVLTELLEQSRKKLAADPAKAKSLATEPLGPLPAGMDTTELAAWTVVANVLLNLDETLLPR